MMVVMKVGITIVALCAVGIVLFGLMIWPNERRESEEFDDADEHEDAGV